MKFVLIILVLTAFFGSSQALLDCSRYRTVTQEIMCGLINRAWHDVADSSSLLSCIDSLATAGIDFTRSVEDISAAFGRRSVNDLKDGLKELVAGLKSMETAFRRCKGLEHLVEDLGTTVAEVSSGIGDIIEVTRIIINGIDIYEDVDRAISDWNRHNYVGFGENIADIIVTLA
eukprot:TRINITY_DN1547_c0_g1_i1.p1 TRINITY_DN1547_c0_g1~~TRINITY_DN1547_c0_g1_i1.p1  ORF type:complete len:174 (-),score=41.25 TRINITY_DN1547_c0_g1_i1:235-756(-)